MKFILEGTELEIFKEWDKEHVKTCPVINNGKPYPADSIGFRLTYSFSPSGLGDCVEVSCSCGESKSCTDTSNW